MSQTLLHHNKLFYFTHPDTMSSNKLQEEQIRKLVKKYAKKYCQCHGGDKEDYINLFIQAIKDGFWPNIQASPTQLIHVNQEGGLLPKQDILVQSQLPSKPYLNLQEPFIQQILKAHWPLSKKGTNLMDISPPKPQDITYLHEIVPVTEIKPGEVITPPTHTTKKPTELIPILPVHSTNKNHNTGKQNNGKVSVKLPPVETAHTTPVPTFHFPVTQHYGIFKKHEPHKTPSPIIVPPVYVEPQPNTTSEPTPVVIPTTVPATTVVPQPNPMPVPTSVPVLPQPAVVQPHTFYTSTPIATGVSIPPLSVPPVTVNPEPANLPIAPTPVSVAPLVNVEPEDISMSEAPLPPAQVPQSTTSFTKPNIPEANREAQILGENTVRQHILAEQQKRDVEASINHAAETAHAIQQQQAFSNQNAVVLPVQAQEELLQQIHHEAENLAAETVAPPVTVVADNVPSTLEKPIEKPPVEEIKSAVSVPVEEPVVPAEEKKEQVATPMQPPPSVAKRKRPHGEEETEYTPIPHRSVQQLNAAQQEPIGRTRVKARRIGKPVPVTPLVTPTTSYVPTRIFNEELKRAARQERREETAAKRSHQLYQNFTQQVPNTKPNATPLQQQHIELTPEAKRLEESLNTQRLNSLRQQRQEAKQRPYEPSLQTILQESAPSSAASLAEERKQLARQQKQRNKHIKNLQKLYVIPEQLTPHHFLQQRLGKPTKAVEATSRPTAVPVPTVPRVEPSEVFQYTPAQVQLPSHAAFSFNATPVPLRKVLQAPRSEERLTTQQSHLTPAPTKVGVSGAPSAPRGPTQLRGGLPIAALGPPALPSTTIPPQPTVLPKLTLAPISRNEEEETEDRPVGPNPYSKNRAKIRLGSYSGHAYPSDMSDSQIESVEERAKLRDRSLAKNPSTVLKSTKNMTDKEFWQWYQALVKRNEQNPATQLPSAKSTSQGAGQTTSYVDMPWESIVVAPTEEARAAKKHAARRQNEEEEEDTTENQPVRTTTKVYGHKRSITGPGALGTGPKPKEKEKHKSKRRQVDPNQMFGLVE